MPLDALIHGVHLYLPEVPDAQLLSAPLYFDEGNQLFVDANTIVGEITLDLIFGGEIFVLVEP
jgi:hypothetical protein